MKLLLAMIFSYVLGAVPNAYILGKLCKGIDIRKHGSGNVGATNVFRVLGKGPGTVVLLLDILKGILAVAVVPDLLGLSEVWHRVVMALIAVSGHNWTVFLNFQGGKGIATSLGVLLGLMIKIAAIRPVVVLTVTIWLLCFLLTGIVSLSSLVAGTLLPILMVWTNQRVEIICLGVIFCIFVILRHRPNIRRLLAGEEPQVQVPFRKKKKA